MNTIKLTPEIMRQRSSQYSIYKEEVNVVKGNLISLLSEIQTEWDGVAANKFTQSFNDNLPAIDNVIDLLEKISIYLTNSANTYEETDINISSSLNI